MRTSFELKIYPKDITEAREQAYKTIADFLGVSPEDVSQLVEMELKVSQVKDKEGSTYLDLLEVTVFANVKQTGLKPFGT